MYSADSTGTNTRSLRDANIPNEEYDNEPIEGFVLNKKVGDYKYNINKFIFKLFGTYNICNHKLINAIITPIPPNIDMHTVEYMTQEVLSLKSA